ncbi:FMN-dependent NADH-azoreductase [Cellulomonas triticagri]|uniref:FMN dependent NADH:quinone oxidoreductase n=1 Tax=Cellulomonas triticagri TaxID=2483352 RepID=A0A3M2IYC9_9CELL|nr:NAD(P)H-dependent oxidoreductase [Cellulomonas triticagri]RMI06927.1 flavodoxin family protein [Cellulomonas triticagri]
MTVLRIDATIQGPASASAALADIVTAELLAARPGETLVHRHLGTTPIPADAWATAVGSGFTPEADRTPEQAAAVALAAEIAGEVRAAEAAVLALPLYNWGVSQHAKAWIDLVIAGGTPGDAVLAGKPVVLITTRGGSYAPGTPKEGWDHGIDYLRRIIGEVWGADLTVIERELTLVGVNPALDAFAEPAALMRKEAEEAAAAAGRALAAR